MLKKKSASLEFAVEINKDERLEYIKSHLNERLKKPYVSDDFTEEAKQNLYTGMEIALLNAEKKLTAEHIIDVFNAMNPEIRTNMKFPLRRHSVAFNTSNSVVSEQGVLELLVWAEKNATGYGPRFELLDQYGSPKHFKTVQEMSASFGCESNERLAKKLFNHLKKENPPTLRYVPPFDSINPFIDLNELTAKQAKELERYKPQFKNYQDYDAIQPKFENLITEFNKISQPSLIDIASFIKSMLLLHPFPDGNTRTFSLGILNQLLLKNKWGICLDLDPRIVLLSSAEIATAIENKLIKLKQIGADKLPTVIQMSSNELHALNSCKLDEVVSQDKEKREQKAGLNIIEKTADANFKLNAALNTIVDFANENRNLRISLFTQEGFYAFRFNLRSTGATTNGNYKQPTFSDLQKEVTKYDLSSFPFKKIEFRLSDSGPNLADLSYKNGQFTLVFDDSYRRDPRVETFCRKLNETLAISSSLETDKPLQKKETLDSLLNNKKEQLESILSPVGEQLVSQRLSKRIQSPAEDTSTLDKLILRLDRLNKPSSLNEIDIPDSLEQIALDLNKIYRTSVVPETVVKKQQNLVNKIIEQAQTGDELYALSLLAATYSNGYKEPRYHFLQKAAEKGHLKSLTYMTTAVFAGYCKPLEESIKWGLNCLRYLEEIAIPKLKKADPNSEQLAHIQESLAELRERRKDILPKTIPRNTIDFNELVIKVVKYRMERGGDSITSFNISPDSIEQLEKNQSTIPKSLTDAVESSQSDPKFNEHDKMEIDSIKENTSQLEKKETIENNLRTVAESAVIGLTTDTPALSNEKKQSLLTNIFNNKAIIEGLKTRVKGKPGSIDYIINQLCQKRYDSRDEAEEKFLHVDRGYDISGYTPMLQVINFVEQNLDEPFTPAILAKILDAEYGNNYYTYSIRSTMSSSAETSCAFLYFSLIGPRCALSEKKLNSITNLNDGRNLSGEIGSFLAVVLNGKPALRPDVLVDALIGEVDLPSGLDNIPLIFAFLHHKDAMNLIMDKLKLAPQELQRLTHFIRDNQTSPYLETIKKEQSESTPSLVGIQLATHGLFKSTKPVEIQKPVQNTECDSESTQKTEQDEKMELSEQHEDQGYFCSIQ
ncbi:hypothetical protein Lgra_0199 [Legionella gratiana]|uniref:Chaperone protein DnaJ 1 n=1 Tax=Legionella gratiana TaxID=45066 RepID=A0A378JB81_9GAMM|nr:Fic family protein [Legionella gratiana]KTD15533.1 hypothetical protein Lgra_0199 [Legionella gratiana]STX45124.1 Chaperone protein DnaJ 1 [Legionella gratiana]